MNCREPDLDWDCDKKGCFNVKKRLKFRAFIDGLPIRMRSMSDIDGFYERNGYCCFIEAKDNVDVSKAQMLAFKNLSALNEKIICFCIDVDAETMDLRSWFAIHKGRAYDTEYGNMADFNERMKQWSDMADNFEFEREKAKLLRKEA